MNHDASRHPSAVQLDALAVGHGDEAVRSHVESCASCTRYVEEIRQGTRAFAEDDAAAARFVQAVRARDRARDAERARRRRRGWGWGAGSALALAAAVLLFVRFIPSPAHVPETGAVRFKGTMQVAAIVEHAGVQSRRVGALELEPGDRIRLEMALDHEDRVTAGVLADDGQWAELQAPAQVKAGTHYSEHSVTFDHDVPRGWILVGPAPAVDEARRNAAARSTHDALIAIRLGPKVP